MSDKQTTILAIETSCDETAIAVLSREDNTIQVLAQAVASQIDIHKATGGVVPDVAAREHTKVIGPLLASVLKESGVDPKNLDAIAVTFGPGLMPALAVGVQAARTLALALQKPLIPIHHIEGHVVSALLSSEEGSSASRQTQFAIPNSEDVFPALALIVSGGHSMLIEVSNWQQYQVIGHTRDDAAGEVFDKVARMLELPYPGGPQVSKLAEQGNAEAIDFPRPMKDSKDLDFSFSGLKTAVLYELRDNPTARREDVAASFQMAVVDSLIGKTKMALRSSASSERPEEFDGRQAQGKRYRTLLLAGGVAANKLLRQRVEELAQQESIALHVAPLWLCGDNAVMIGQAAIVADHQPIKWSQVEPTARVSIDQAA